MQTFAKFSLKWSEIQEKPFGGRAPLGPAGGAYSAPPDPIAGLQVEGQGGRGRGKGEGRNGKGSGKMNE